MTNLSSRILPLFCTSLYITAVSIGAFSGGLWATLGIGGAVVLFLGLWATDKRMPLPPKHFAYFVCAVLVVLAAELPLSSQVGLSLTTWGRLASIFLPLLLLTAPRLQAFVYTPAFIPTVALTTGIGALVLGIELHSGGFLIHALKKPTASLTEYNRGIAHVVILAFSLFAGLWVTKRKREAVALALILLFPAGLTESHTAKLALIVGMFCTAAAFYRPIFMQRALAVGAVSLMGWPFYAQYFFSTYYSAVERFHDSWRHRVEIWDYLSYRIAERPVFGWGLGTTHTLDYTQPHGELYRFAVLAAPHAHNFVTEIWVEAGVFGLVAGLVFLLWTLRRASSLHTSLRPFALGGWAAAVTVSLFGFDFWTDALWAAFALSAFAFGMLQQQIEREANLSHT